MMVKMTDGSATIATNTILSLVPADPQLFLLLVLLSQLRHYDDSRLELRMMLC